MGNGNTFVPEAGITNSSSSNNGIDSIEISKGISLIQRALLGTNTNIGDLEELSSMLSDYNQINPVNSGIRIPLSHIGNEDSIKQVLGDLKASHTLGVEGSQEVIIIGKELISKLRTRIIMLTKNKVLVLLNDGICSDTVRKCIDGMKEQLSLLGVTKKELANII